MESVWDLWMAAHVRAAQDSEVTVLGNGHSPGAVIDTIRFFIIAMGGKESDIVVPTRQEMIDYLTAIGQENEIEYLMEE